jgi:two-component system, OmpR family, phosphate regulon sensor histidine kinase PhoR
MGKSPLKAGKLALKTNILDSLRDAVILVNDNREVIGFNRAADEVVALKDKGKDLSQCFYDQDLLDAVEQVLRNGKPIVKESMFPFPVGRAYTVDITSLSSEDENKKSGVMLTMHDITSIRTNERIRADFVANVSHELRSPLTTLMGFIETMQGAEELDSARQKDFLSIMAQESHRMALLLEDLLSLSLIEAHEHERPVGLVAVSEIVSPVVERLQNRAEKKSMDIVVKYPKEDIQVRGEKTQLVQVVENLIDNAIKYGDPKTRINVSVMREKLVADIPSPALAIAVKNRGDGIAEEDIPRLTERFYRVDKTRSQAVGGTGLGLAIVKHILNRHRGKLHIASVLGEESVFTAYISQ